MLNKQLFSGIASRAVMTKMMIHLSIMQNMGSYSVLGIIWEFGDWIPISISSIVLGKRDRQQCLQSMDICHYGIQRMWNCQSLEDHYLQY